MDCSVLYLNIQCPTILGDRIFLLGQKKNLPERIIMFSEWLEANRRQSSEWKHRIFSAKATVLELDRGREIRH